MPRITNLAGCAAMSLAMCASVGAQKPATADQATVTSADVAKAVSGEDYLKGQLLSPKAFRAATAKIMPSVVTIESFGGLRSTTQK
jgi:hypothetical protein